MKHAGTQTDSVSTRSTVCRLTACSVTQLEILDTPRTPKLKFDTAISKSISPSIDSNAQSEFLKQQVEGLIKNIDLSPLVDLLDARLNTRSNELKVAIEGLQHRVTQIDASMDTRMKQFRIQAAARQS